MVNRLRRVLPSLPWLAPALIILLIAYLLPLAKVLTVSVLEPAAGFGNYEKLLLDEGMRHIFWTTFRISGITTVISVALGYVVALAMVNAPLRQFHLMLVCVLIPFWISVLVRAFAWVVLLRSGGVINSALIALGIIKEPLDLLYNDFGVVVGMVHYMVPLAVLTIYGQMSGIDTRLAMAARGLGAGPTYAFARVFFPLSVPGIAAAAILIFITALGFYIVPAAARWRQDTDAGRVRQPDDQRHRRLGNGNRNGIYTRHPCVHDDVRDVADRGSAPCIWGSLRP